MTLFDRYLSRLWFANFLVVCAFSAGLIILQDTYNYFLDMVGAQLNLLQIAEFFLLSTIVNFPTITPFAFFVSIIFTLTALQKTEQITILKSCGLSLFRISLSFWLMAILLSALTLFISSTLIPKVSDARNAYIELCTQSLVEPEQERKKSTLTFQNAKSNRLWYIEHFDEYALKGGHSILHQLNEAGVEISRVVAQSSIYDQDLETWTFSNGTEIIFDSITGDPLQSINFESKQFIELEEQYKLNRKKAAQAVFLLTTAGVLFVLYNSEGLKALDTMDYWISNLLMVSLATAQIIIFAWIIGIDTGLSSAHEGAKIKIPRIYAFIIKYITPCLLIFILGNWLIDIFSSIISQGKNGSSNSYITDLFIKPNPVALQSVAILAGLGCFIGWSLKRNQN